MKISVLTLFPEMFPSVLYTSILGRAAQKGLLTFEVRNIRDYALNKHNQADDYPFGGGAGMLMMAQPIFDCMAAAQADMQGSVRRIYLSPRGERLTTQIAKRLAQEEHLILLCGHYEGIDERVCEHIIDEEISLGDFVLTGGEIAAMALIDSVARFVPGVLGSELSAHDESFSEGLLEYPQYTRPYDFRGYRVPEVLIGGNHAEINRWRRREALRITKQRRPDLLEKAELTEADRAYLATIESYCHE